AQQDFALTLDFSGPSIELVEQILDDMHRCHAQLSEQRTWLLAKIFGGYIGEVMRRHHRAEWGIIIGHDGRELPGIMIPETPEVEEWLVWPWGRAHKRIVEGAENNVWHYYLNLTQP